METTKLRIHTWPEEILKKECKRVGEVDDAIRAYFKEMIALMRVSGGVGLAANQAGLDLSLIVIEYQDRIFRLVNPRIIRGEGSISFIEGCLSFPGLEVEVRRSEKVWVRALDEKGASVVLEADGFLAIVFQHEIDHINGIPFIERISFWQRLKITPKLKLIIRRTKNGLRKQEKKSSSL